MTTPFLGSIQYYAFNFAPRGWHACDGALLPITQYQALFAVLGTYYGGDGRTTFALPDLRGRSMIGAYLGGTPNPGLSTYQIGTRGGVTSATIPASALAQHTHTATGIKVAANTVAADSGNPINEVPSVGSGSSGPTNAYTSAAGTNTFLGAASIIVNTAGGSQPFNVLNPYQALNCCVALQGIFPSRN